MLYAEQALRAAQALDDRLVHSLLNDSQRSAILRHAELRGIICPPYPSCDKVPVNTRESGIAACCRKPDVVDFVRRPLT